MPAPQPFDTLIPEARAYLSELDANNTREWFLDNKDRYDSELKAPALALLDAVAADLERMTGHRVSPKLFRPQRDIRFSKDKTPYKTHLHMLWDIDGGSGSGLDRSAFYFGVELDRIVLGGGCMGMDKAKLAAFRKRVASPKGKDLMRAMAAASAEGTRFSDPDLKRVPAPFPTDHPQGELLKHKTLTFWREVDCDTKDLRKTLQGGFAKLMPLQEWLLALK